MSLLLLFPGAGGVTRMKFPVMCSTTATANVSNTAANFWSLSSSSNNNAWRPAATRHECSLPVAGDISDFWVRIPTALSGAETWTFVLQKNNVDTNMKVVFTSATGQIQSFTSEYLDCNYGDTISFRSVPGASMTTTLANIAFGFLFTAVEKRAFFCATWLAIVAETSFSTISGVGASGTVLSGRSPRMPCAGTISRMILNVPVAPGAGFNRKVTLLKNGVDTALVATISDTALVATATPTPITFVEGDLVALRQDSTTAAGATLTAMVDWVPDSGTEFPLVSPGTGAVDPTTIRFGLLNGHSGITEATETNVYNIVPTAFNYKKMRPDLGTAPGGVKDRTFTLRQNGSSTSVTVSLTGTEVVDSWTGSVAFAAGDLVDWMQVPTGNPTASNPVQVSSVIEIPLPAVGTYLYKGASNRAGVYMGAQASDSAYYKGALTGVFSS